MKFRGIIGKTKGRFVSEARWMREREIVERRINKAGQAMRQAIKARDAAKSPKVKEKWQKVLDKARPKQSKELQQRARLEHQGQRIGKGRWVEVTMRMRRTVPRGDPGARQNRLRMLKIRAEVTKAGATKAEVERAVERAIRHGSKTKGVRLRFADWEAARDRPGGDEKSKGRLEGDVAKQLEAFKGLLRRNAISTREAKDVGSRRTGGAHKKGPSRRRAR